MLISYTVKRRSGIGNFLSVMVSSNVPDLFSRSLGENSEVTCSSAESLLPGQSRAKDKVGTKEQEGQPGCFLCPSASPDTGIQDRGLGTANEDRVAQEMGTGGHFATHSQTLHGVF